MKEHLLKNLTKIALCCVATLIVTPAFAQSSGADTYKAKCQMCHGADGLAATPMGKMYAIPSFKSPAVAKASEADLFAAIKNGKNKMPKYGDKLTDDQIKAVLVHVRSLTK